MPVAPGTRVRHYAKVPDRKFFILSEQTPTWWRMDEPYLTDFYMYLKNEYVNYEILLERGDDEDPDVIIIHEALKGIAILITFKVIEGNAHLYIIGRPAADVYIGNYQGEINTGHLDTVAERVVRKAREWLRGVQEADAPNNRTLSAEGTPRSEASAGGARVGRKRRGVGTRRKRAGRRTTRRG